MKVRNHKGRKFSKFAPDEGNRYDGIYKVESGCGLRAVVIASMMGFTGGEVLACQEQCRVCCVEVLAEKG